jgi:hypothetical protein
MENEIPILRLKNLKVLPLKNKRDLRKMTCQLFQRESILTPKKPILSTLQPIIHIMTLIFRALSNLQIHIRLLFLKHLWLQPLSQELKQLPPPLLQLIKTIVIQLLRYVFFPTRSIIPNYFPLTQIISSAHQRIVLNLFCLLLSQSR